LANSISTYQFNGFCLRPFKYEDHTSLAYYANNETIANNLRDFFPHPYTEQDAKDWIDYCQVVSNDLLLAIVINDEVVGSIGALFKSDIYRLNVEIGFWLNPLFWNKGITTQSIQFIVNHIFNTYDIQRIYANVFPRNLASQRVLQKCGFKLEARHERAIIKDNVIMDELVFVLLRP
jgi:RimJ/RimL family protein N-acetyltransferase